MARKTAVEREIQTAHPDNWDHQNQSLAFFSSTPIGFDNSDPGTGKTAVQVQLYARRPKPKKRWLILCPKTLMVSAWGDDIEKFGPDLTVSFGFADQREEAFLMDTDVVVLNVDGVKWLNDKKNLKYLAEFDHLTIDEYTTYKHPTSQRSKAAAVIRKYFKYRYALSGTPNPNSVMELWHPTLLLDDGKRLGTSYFHLRNKVQIPVQNGPRPEHVKWEDKPGAEQAITDILADITIRHRFEDVMTHVPANHRDVKMFDLSKSCKKAYDKMEDDLILALEDATVNAVHAASLRTKLLQIASGAVYTGGEDSAYKLVDSGRYELIADLVEEQDHSVVFFNWKHQRDFLAKEFDKRNITFAIIDGSVTKKGERERIVAGYQSGEYNTILLHPRTGAHGLTLTRGTRTIFSSPFYEADLMEQAIRRIYRGTQNQVTNTVFVQARGTVEKDVYDRLNGKNARMQDLLALMVDRSKSRSKK